MSYSRSLVVVLAGLTLGLAGCESSVTLDLDPEQSSQVNAVYSEDTNVQSGLSFQQVDVNIHDKAERLAITTIDPATAYLKIAQSDGSGKTVAEWQDELNATVVINAGYFDPEFNLTTRTIVNGVSYGPLLSGLTGVARSLDGESWTISDTEAVPEGTAPVFSLQSYPMLIENSEVVFTTGSENIAQRSVLATDADGRLYIILAEYGVLTLNELAVVLNEQVPMELEAALNLDGGTSSGLVVEGESVQWYNSSLPVSSVLYIQ